MSIRLGNKFPNENLNRRIFRNRGKFPKSDSPRENKNVLSSPSNRFRYGMILPHSSQQYGR
ncbi:hypothetical protein LEP1GSC061_3925 [Leptospira wolffii serovar Khorat str. Khorat-H2]|nr:hypothetical protein LEP1GSC061_3925 [Leptospira wolffii serovar Khorat str. Khorat-H2]